MFMGQCIYDCRSRATCKPYLISMLELFDGQS